MALPGNNNEARVGPAPWLLRRANEDISSVLLAVGAATCATAVHAAVSFPPPYYPYPPAPERVAVLPRGVRMGALVAAVVAGFCTIWAAVWVAADAPRRRATGQVIFCASLVALVVTVALSGEDHRLALSIVEAML